jgi:AraC family transcriptional regulator of adaptative response/methylated-DNA-[protein]-cysteine methyltransferase
MGTADVKEELAGVTTSDPRWALVVARDPTADELFYYSVRTTGVYCRPSCAARLARPENVRFHRTRGEAEQGGFRPCKRCKPNQPSGREQIASKITKVCRFIERSEEIPVLKQMAAHVGMSVYHFHRTFKKATGLTPKLFAIARRKERIRSSLGQVQTVTDAIYASGFTSSSRFYAKSKDLLGMTPSKYRRGGVGTDIFFAIGECSLGSILVAQTEHGVCSIQIGEDPSKLIQALQDQFPQANLIGNESRFEDLVAKVVGLVEHPAIGFDLPLDIRGTAFQQRVWHALQQIPLGTTATYSDIALQSGSPKAIRAVAQACGANSLALAIPCHRVIRSDGSLSGYRWGVERKRALLEREAQA